MSIDTPIELLQRRLDELQALLAIFGPELILEV
jgi:hypothetical protein